MTKRMNVVAAFCVLLSCSSVFGGGPLDPQLAALEKTFSYQAGNVVVGSGLATLHLGTDYRFLSEVNAKTVLVDVWGNPAESVRDVMGLIVPAKISPLADEGWAVVVTYDDDGHVDDEDAAETDYNVLLKQMQENTRSANAERTKLGYDAMDLVGWAKPPTYDSAAKKVIWAKELAIAGDPEHTLNYDVRVLGRRGTLSLNAVASMSQLSQIESAMATVSKNAEFNAGERYADYDASTDKLATYGVAGLIAGTLAAKTGLLKGLLIAILAAKKFVIIGLVALGAGIRKLFSMNKGGGASGTPAQIDRA